jgi:hypothetical protein
MMVGLIGENFVTRAGRMEDKAVSRRKGNGEPPHAQKKVSEQVYLGR